MADGELEKALFDDQVDTAGLTAWTIYLAKLDVGDRRVLRKFVDGLCSIIADEQRESAVWPEAVFQAADALENRGVFSLEAIDAKVFDPLIGALERRLFSGDGRHQALTPSQKRDLAFAFARFGGDLRPARLDALDDVRASEPAIWFELGLEFSWVGSTETAVQKTKALIADDNAFGWEVIRRYGSDIKRCVPRKELNKFYVGIIDAVPSGKHRKAYREWLADKRGISTSASTSGKSKMAFAPRRPTAKKATGRSHERGWLSLVVNTPRASELMLGGRGRPSTGRGG